MVRRVAQGVAAEAAEGARLHPEGRLRHAAQRAVAEEERRAALGLRAGHEAAAAAGHLAHLLGESQACAQVWFLLFCRI